MANPTVAQSVFTLFDEQLYHLFQQYGSVFQGRMKVKMVNGAGTYTINRIGETGSPQQKASGALVAENVATQDTVDITVRRYIADMYLDRQDLDVTKLDLIPGYAKTLLASMNRHLDDLAIDELGNTTTANVGTAGDGLTFAKVLAMTQTMDNANIPQTGRKWVIGPTQKTDFLSMVTATGNWAVSTSGDFVSGSPLMSGQLPKTWMGFEWLVSNRLDVAAGVRTTYAWHEDAIVCGWNRNLTPAIDWIPERTSWLILNEMNLGYKIVEDAGVFPSDCTE